MAKQFQKSEEREKLRNLERERKECSRKTNTDPKKVTLKLNEKLKRKQNEAREKKIHKRNPQVYHLTHYFWGGVALDLLRMGNWCWKYWLLLEDSGAWSAPCWPCLCLPRAVSHSFRPSRLWLARFSLSESGGLQARILESTVQYWLPYTSRAL